MPSRTETNEALYASVEVLSKTKSRAEDCVKLARSLATPAELLALQVLYSEARSNINASLDRLLIELQTVGARAAVAESYERVAERAAEHAQRFLEASDDLIIGADMSIVEAGIKAVSSLASALVDVWKTLRGEKKERFAHLTKRLESFKWEHFEQIGQEGG
jgi:hypothetical protein